MRPKLDITTTHLGAAGELVTKIETVDLAVDPKWAPPKSGLADTGARVSSITGGLREPKPVDDGRWDLIPAECVVRICDAPSRGQKRAEGALWSLLGGYRGDDGVAIFLRMIIKHMGGFPAAMHRLAVLYAKGAVKYTSPAGDGSRNWEKGLPLGSFVNSGLRHYRKHQCGMIDEDHLAAVLWNFCGLMWTQARIADGRLPKELDDYGLCK